MMGKGWWAAVAVLAALGVLLRQDLLLLISLLLALVGGASYLWTRYCLAGVTYRRRIGANRLFFGEETDLQVEITNAKPLPLAWLRVEDEFPAALELSGGQLYPFLSDRRRLINLLSLRWYERVRRRYRVRGARRGVWTFGPATIISGDIFGLGVQRQKEEDVGVLLVYPQIVPVAALGLPAKHPFGDYRTHQRIMTDPMRLMSARDYTPGDSYRYIHWKTTARRSALHTKVFEPSASRPLAIFLNVNTFEFLYEGLDTELQEYAITAAASIARYAHDMGHHVGLYANSVAWPTSGRIRIRPGNHPDQLVRIFEALAGIANYGRWPIEAVMQVERSDLPYGTTVVVISAVAGEQLRKTLLDMQRHGYAVTLVKLGDGQLESPLPGVQCYHIGGREAWHELETLRLA